MKILLVVLLAALPALAEEDLSDPPEAQGVLADPSIACGNALAPSCGEGQEPVCTDQKWKCVDSSKICKTAPPQCGDEQERKCADGKWKCVDKPKCSGKQPKCSAGKLLVCQSSGLWSCQRDPSKPVPKRLERADPVR